MLQKSDKPILIGLTGAFGSGKSTAAEFFQSKGFNHIVLSSFLEDGVKKQNDGIVTREVLQNVGNEWREKYGSGILAQKTLDLVQEQKLTKVVIDGIRNIGEIEVLRQNENFILLAVVTDRRTRFERLKSLKRREELTWELFEKLDLRDLGIHEKDTGLQVAFCIALADRYIENNGMIEEFRNKLEILIHTL